jgi:hypothetical protein
MSRSVLIIREIFSQAMPRLALLLALMPVPASAANDALQDIAPCLTPQDGGEANLAALELLGWSPVTEGPEFTRAARASAEIRNVTRLLPYAFDGNAEASDFLEAALWRAEERAATGIVLTREYQNLLIERVELDDSVFVTCIWSSRRLAIVEDSLEATPVEGPTGEPMAFNAGILPWPALLETADPGDVSLWRLIIPFPASLQAAGGQAVIVSLTIPAADEADQ